MANVTKEQHEQLITDAIADGAQRGVCDAKGKSLPQKHRERRVIMSQRAYEIAEDGKCLFSIVNEWEVVSPYILNIDPDMGEGSFDFGCQVTLALDVGKMRQDMLYHEKQLAFLSRIVNDCKSTRDVVLCDVC